MHIGLLPRIHAARFPDKVAARDPWRAVTYRELEARTNRLAQSLLAQGVRKGDLVGIVMGNRVEHLEAAFAVAKTGAVGVPLDPDWTEVEFSRAAKFFSISAFFVQDEIVEILARSLEGPGSGEMKLVVLGEHVRESFLGYEDLIQQGEDSFPAISISEQDPFMIMLTSGTTGTPKGCIVSHGSYLYRSLPYSVEFKMGADEREVVALPLFLGAGRGTLFANLTWGASVILEPKFDPVRFLDIVTREKVTTFGLVPTAFQSLVDVVDTMAFDGSSLHSIRNTGASLPMGLRQKVCEKINPNLYQTYASVDTGVIAVLRPNEMQGEPTRAGRPIWGMEMKIADKNGQDVQVGKMGEIVCRGPLVSDGYYRNPNATSTAFYGEWFKTGDLGCVDQEGYLFVRGRLKNLIKSGGRSVFPDEVEFTLLGHPDVHEVAVFGMPDAKWGEAVHAAVVLKPRRSLSGKELIEFCTGQLARYKCPKSIHIMSGLPRGNLGKVSIETLREKVGPRS